MIDTHAHLIDDCYNGKVDEIILNMAENGLTKVFTVSYNYDSIIKCVKLAEKYDNVYAIIGIHPEEWKEFEKSKDMLNGYLDHPKVVGVGEIGLDYHYPDTNKVEQHKIFVEQIKLAYAHKLPIAIHVRDAIGDLIEVLKQNKDMLKYGVLIHCFSESVESFDELKKLGCKVAFGGVSTFKNAVKVKDVIKHAELTDFVLETDCPYLTPEPMRGKVMNEPKFVKYICENIANIKGVDFATIDKCTTDNALELFTKAK